MFSNDYKDIQIGDIVQVDLPSCDNLTHCFITHNLMGKMAWASRTMIGDEPIAVTPKNFRGIFKRPTETPLVTTWE